MYSYDRYKFDLRNASPVTVSSTPADRDAALLRTYKKTSAEMAMSSNVRRDEQTSKALLLQHNRRLREAVEEEKNRDSRIWRPRKTLGGEPVWRHRFRERRVDKEVGPTGHVSGTRYVPRAAYHGGGLLNPPLTLAIRQRAEPVAALDPRPATASVVDGGRVCGRLKRTLYSGPVPNGGLRQREPSKEIQPPLRFKAQTESERVNDSITRNSVQDAGPWQRGVGNDIVWRPVTPEKWVGGRFRRVTTPANNLRERMDGSPVAKGFGADGEVFVVSPISGGMRERDKAGELSGEFSTVVERDAWTRSPHEWKNPSVFNEEHADGDVNMNNSLREVKYSNFKPGGDEGKGDEEVASFY